MFRAVLQYVQLFASFRTFNILLNVQHGAILYVSIVHDDILNRGMINWFVSFTEA